MKYDDYDCPESGYDAEAYYSECDDAEDVDAEDVVAQDLLDALMHDAPEWWLRRAEAMEPDGDAGEVDAGDLHDAPPDEDELPF